MRAEERKGIWSPWCHRDTFVRACDQISVSFIIVKGEHNAIYPKHMKHAEVKPDGTY